MKKYNLSIANYITIAIYWLVGAFLVIAPTVQIVRGYKMYGFEAWQIAMATLPILGVLLAIAATKDTIEESNY